MAVHDRHPYVGEYVYTAFSGSHQDAINKGMRVQETRDNDIWEVPYLPIDPQDVGRTYQSIIRINSQSGKGGVAYIMDHQFGFKLPKSMHPEFGRVIQQVTDKTGDELPSDEIYMVFEAEYLKKTYPFHLKECHIHMDADEGNSTGTVVKATVGINGDSITFDSKGNGPIDAFVKGLNQHSELKFSLQTYDEHDIDHASDSRAVAYISVKTTSGRSAFGVGMDPNISMASIKAILSALNRLSAQ
jgi:2-isopropylmalate synthase